MCVWTWYAFLGMCVEIKGQLKGVCPSPIRELRIKLSYHVWQHTPSLTESSSWLFSCLNRWTWIPQVCLPPHPLTFHTSDGHFQIIHSHLFCHLSAARFSATQDHLPLPEHLVHFSAFVVLLSDSLNKHSYTVLGVYCSYSTGGDIGFTKYVLWPEYYFNFPSSRIMQPTSFSSSSKSTREVLLNM